MAFITLFSILRQFLTQPHFIFSFKFGIENSIGRNTKVNPLIPNPKSVFKFKFWIFHFRIKDNSKLWLQKCKIAMTLFQNYLRKLDVSKVLVRCTKTTNKLKMQAKLTLAGQVEQKTKHLTKNNPKTENPNPKSARFSRLDYSALSNFIE